MIRGMTGFGSSSLSWGAVKGVVEIKSLNHRYLDIAYSFPTGFSSIENKVRDIIQKNVERGRVSISIKITNKPIEILDFNQEACEKYLKFASVISKKFNLDDKLSLSDLIRLPGVVESKETVITGDLLWPAIEKSLKSSLSQLRVMRKREGQSLSRDVSENLKMMTGLIKIIRVRYSSILKEKKKIFSVDEFVSYQKNSDISEELTRLQHYIHEAKKLLQTDVEVGKKLDFIAQEMQRETNTIGSKVQENVVSNAVISLKSKIEKIREQSQNIE